MTAMPRRRPKSPSFRPQAVIVSNAIRRVPVDHYEPSAGVPSADTAVAVA